MYCICCKPIIGGVINEVSRDNFKDINSHVNIDVAYSDDSADESKSDKIDIQPVFRMSIRLKTKYVNFKYCYHHM